MEVLQPRSCLGDSQLELNLRIANFQQQLNEFKPSAQEPPSLTLDDNLRTASDNLDKLMAIETAIKRYQNGTQSTLRRLSSGSDSGTDPDDDYPPAPAYDPTPAFEHLLSMLNQYKLTQQKALATALHALRTSAFSDANELKQFMQKSWGGDTTILHLAAILDDASLFEAAVSYGIDVNAKDSAGNSAVFYAFDKPLLLTKLLSLRPDTTDLRHPNGSLINNYLTDCSKAVPEGEADAYEAHRDYKLASALFNPKFFAELFSCFLDYQGLIKQHKAALKHYDKMAAVSTEEDQLGYNILLTIQVIYHVTLPFQAVVHRLFIDEDIELKQLQQLDLYEAERQVNRYLQKYYHHHDPNPDLAKTEKNLLNVHARWNLRFISFLERYQQMRTAIETRFPEWQPDVSKTLKQQIAYAHRDYGKTKLKAFLAFISQQVKKFDSRGFQEY